MNMSIEEPLQMVHHTAATTDRCRNMCGAMVAVFGVYTWTKQKAIRRTMARVRRAMMRAFDHCMSC
jgi:hypothetical protein